MNVIINYQQRERRNKAVYADRESYQKPFKYHGNSARDTKGENANEKKNGSFNGISGHDDVIRNDCISFRESG